MSLSFGSLPDCQKFDDGDYQESDFEVGNYFTSTHPNSKFVKELIAVRVDNEFVEFINGKTYTTIENGLRTDHEIKDKDEFQSYLKKFKITKSYDFNQVILKYS